MQTEVLKSIDMCDTIADNTADTSQNPPSDMLLHYMRERRRSIKTELLAVEAFLKQWEKPKAQGN